MGYDLMRFVDEVDEELHCSICSMVFENPVDTPCTHTFCNECLIGWLSTNAACPIDRTPLSEIELRPSPRVFRNILAKLIIKCDFDGCGAVVELGHRQNHLANCVSNPSAEIVCDKGCARKILRFEQQAHNCLAHLSNLIDRQAAEITNLTDEAIQREKEFSTLKEHNVELTIEVADRKKECRQLSRENVQLKREISSLKDEGRCVTGQDNVANSVMKWEFGNEIRFCKQSNVLGRVGIGSGYAQLNKPLRTGNSSLKVEILSQPGSIRIGLKPRDGINYFGNLIYFASNGLINYKGTFHRNLGAWKVGDVIECGVENPEDLNENTSADIVVYFSRNGNLVRKKTVNVQRNQLLPGIWLYRISDKVKILTC